MVRFVNLKHTLTVVQEGVFFFDDKMFIVTAWTPKMDINMEATSTLPIQVQFHNLDIKY